MRGLIRMSVYLSIEINIQTGFGCKLPNFRVFFHAKPFAMLNQNNSVVQSKITRAAARTRIANCVSYFSFEGKISQH